MSYLTSLKRDRARGEGVLECEDLEALFVQAFTDPGVRPAFYRALLAGHLWVFVVPSFDPSNASIVSYIRSDGAQVVPCFTSKSATSLYGSIDAGSVRDPKVSCMPSRALMERTKGLYLHFNPRSEMSRDFSPGEIDMLLKRGTIHSGPQSSEVVPAGTDIQLTRLNVSIPDLENALRVAFARMPEVASAYLVEAERMRAGQLKSGLLMVAFAPPSALITNAVSTIFSDVYAGTLPVDFCFDSGERGFVEALQSIRAVPFYLRDTLASDDVSIVT
jgi:hypothetical protein